MTLHEFLEATRGKSLAIIDDDQAVSLAKDMGLDDPMHGLHVSEWLTELCVGGRRCYIADVQVMLASAG